jgi:hypothetical protein
MSVRIDVDCQRCHKRIGTAKVSVALHGSFQAFDSAQPCERRLLVDEDDLEYWKDRHSIEECDAEIVHKKALTKS